MENSSVRDRERRHASCVVVHNRGYVTTYVVLLCRHMWQCGWSF